MKTRELTAGAHARTDRELVAKEVPAAHRSRRAVGQSKVSRQAKAEAAVPAKPRGPSQQRQPKAAQKD